MSIYEQRAIQWCERYGIVEYKLKKNLLIYNVSYPAYLGNSHYTIKHIVNLDTMQETTQQLKRYDPKGAYNRL